jgi:hypothetical protein
MSEQGCRNDIALRHISEQRCGNDNAKSKTFVPYLAPPATQMGLGEPRAIFLSSLFDASKMTTKLAVHHNQTKFVNPPNVGFLCVSKRGHKILLMVRRPRSLLYTTIK